MISHDALQTYNTQMTAHSVIIIDYWENLRLEKHLSEGCKKKIQTFYLFSRLNINIVISQTYFRPENFFANFKTFQEFKTLKKTVRLFLSPLL